ncbi:Proton-dependent oligopeptide transporter family [Corchorus olitorius]|uniref:Proton-dependent oligopeptide transporter family n=1 Tax=Corchorus olitorius TaxID=93759 RepID=A0A1R3HNP9_9ROSI|nr:Proton-dependent oligopeptide transporter family [Corchorus olitorius]
MRICDELRIWFRLPERLVIFTFGLLFSKGLMAYVLANLMTFLTDFWNLKLKQALAIVNLQDGLRNMLQIHVALCIDACVGYRWMLILSSLLYSSGLFLLAFSVPQFFFDNVKVCPVGKGQCFEKLKDTPFWEGLALLILGGAAQVIPLYSLSFEQTKTVKAPQGFKPTRVKIGCCLCKVKIGGWRQLQQSIIRLFCFGFMLLGTITSVYGFISFKRKWHQRFLIPAIAIGISLLWFTCGFPLYGSRHLQPSPLSTMLHALVAAARKRHLSYQGNLEQLHHGEGEEKLPVTDHLKWLNKAAVKSLTDDNLMMDEKIRWRLCTVKEVEQTKLLLNMIPMSVTFIAYGMVKSLGNTFFVEQANNMRGGVPIVVFQMIQGSSKGVVKSIYKTVFEKRIKRNKRQYSDGVKIGIGMLASVACCSVASLVETKRLKALGREGLSNDPNAIAPISAFWLVLQFFLLGAMEGLAGDGIQDFFGHYAPDSRRYGPVFTSSLIGFGTVLNIGFIFFLDYYSTSRFNASWLGDSINQSRLDSIYRAYIFVALFNCFFYAYVATKYSYDNIIGLPEEEEEITFLEVKQDEPAAAGADQQSNQEQVNVELQKISVKIGSWRQLQQEIIRWCCIGFMLLGVSISVYGLISFKRKWHQRFLVSAIAILIGLLWFLCGFPFYGPRLLQPSPLSTMLRTLIAAARKRHLSCQHNSEQLHHGDEVERPLLTDHLGWLNKAAVKESMADDDLLIEEKRWRLCTVKEVEQTKFLLSIIPMSMTIIVYGMVRSLGNTFFVEQANSMNGGIPSVVFQMIQEFSKTTVRLGYIMVLEKRIKRIGRRFHDGVKIGLGLLASIICCAVASSVETKRLKALSRNGISNDSNATAPISALWLLPQFFFLGAMEELAGSGIQDFFGHYAPDSRRYGPVFTSSITGFGTVLNIGFIAVLDYYSKSRFNASWLGDRINQSRLDSIYRAYVIIALLNCFLYAHVAARYSYENIIGKPEEEEEIPFLEVKEEEGQVDVDIQKMPLR